MNRLVEIYIILHLLIGAPLDTLITKDQGLPAWYAPGESPSARRALEEMMYTAEQEGVLLWVNSGYREFAYQQAVIQRELLQSPDTYHSFSAEPGHSEHQLGTTFDVAWPGLPVESLDPRNRKLFEWLESNAHSFGFILSYPYKEISVWPYHNRWLPVVTEYIYEPWHIRYVGQPLAEEIWLGGYLDPADPTLPQDYFQPWP